MSRWKPIRKEKQRSSSFGGIPRERASPQHERPPEHGHELLFTTQSNSYLDYDDWAAVEKSQSELTILKKDDDLKHAEVVIVVMGPTGAGKSRLIREASMEDVPVGDSLLSSLSSRMLKQCQLKN